MPWFSLPSLYSVVGPGKKYLLQAYSQYLAEDHKDEIWAVQEIKLCSAHARRCLSGRV